MNRKRRKEELRQILLERRSRIPEKVYLEKSARICSNLKEISDFKKAAIIHCYVSLNERREVNTQELIKDLCKAEKKLVVPVTQMSTGSLRHVRLDRFTDLKLNKWGVLEPQGGMQIPVEQLELVVVPMAGGDRQKNRIGYGKGFYDRFLKNVECPTIGLLFDQCLIEEVPVEPFDISLSMLVTENEYIA